MDDLPFRQIHLDFHTSPLIPDVGADFDPAEFVAILKEAAVTSITCFAKCHHGLSYYPTTVGVVHPALRRDLLGEMIAACHAADIQVPVYLSVGWDEHAAETHPEWQQVEKDGRLSGRPPFGSRGWRNLCLNSPYVDYLAAQTEEVVRTYPVDGVFFDIVRQISPGCVCHYCRRSLRDLGLNPEDDQDLARHSRLIVRRFLERFSRLVWSLRPGIRLYYNGRLRLSPRVEEGLRPELPHFSHLEIESLPSGPWGYLHFPTTVRYCQTLGVEVVGMTARFHKSWADFGGLKNPAALAYECFRMLASGARCSIGDQLHPRGRLERAAYQLIGQVYRQVAAKEPWCRGARPLAEIGVLLPDTPADPSLARQSLEGAVRMLLETHHQFQVLDAAADLRPYRVLVLPDAVVLDPALVERLRAFLAEGGGLLLSDGSGLAADGRTPLLPDLGVEVLGPAPYTPDYLRLEGDFGAGLPALDLVLYEGGRQVRPRPGATVLARVVYPYFNRTWATFCSHAQTPPDRLSEDAGIVQAGRVIYFAHPIFRAYRRHGYRVYRDLVARCLARLLPTPLVRVAAPTGAEVTLLRQAQPVPRLVCHLLYYVPERRTPEIDIVEDVVPLRAVDLAVRVETPPRRVYLAPEVQDLPWTLDGTSVVTQVPVVHGHQMVVYEW